MQLGGTAADAQQHDEVISHYTIALSVNSGSPQDILLKRSKAYLACGKLKHALDDANQACRFFFHIDESSETIIVRRSNSIHRLHGATR